MPHSSSKILKYLKPLYVLKYVLISFVMVQWLGSLYIFKSVTKGACKNNEEESG